AADRRRRRLSRAVRTHRRRAGARAAAAPASARRVARPPPIDPDAAQARPRPRRAAGPPRRARDRRAQLSAPSITTAKVVVAPRLASARDRASLSYLSFVVTPIAGNMKSPLV